MKKIIDVSMPLKPDMLGWPTDPQFTIERVKDLAKGDKDTLSKLSMSAHSGTHVDAPAHFVLGGETIDKAPFSALLGPARVMEIKDTESIKEEELERHTIKKGERILFKTGNSVLLTDPEFHKDYVYVSLEAAKYLARAGVLLVGVDYLSVGGYKRDGADVHRALLEKSIWIIEGLDLSAASPGAYELICLPLRIIGPEAAPARVLLREL
jgi:arylformamidase